MTVPGGKYGPLLSFGQNSPLTGWALKRVQFSELFIEQIVKGGREIPYPPRIYWLFAFFRLLFVCIPQNGYIHPDEFFQTLEPVAGSVLEVEWKKSWEFNTTFPLRNIALSYISIGFPLRILQIINLVTYIYFDYNIIIPYFVLISPRVFYCLLSFINDYCLLKICYLSGEDFKTKLLFIATSHISFVYATHTFSNSVEMVLFSILLLLVTECVVTSDCIIHHTEILAEKYAKAETIVEKVKLFKLKKLLPDHSLMKCLQIASVITAGIFNRPTFIVFAFPSLFLWLLRGLGSKFISFKDFHARIFVFITSSLPALLILILFDSSYYGYLTISDIESNEITLENFVVTPLNFLRYNLFFDNLKTHGLHPKWLHIVVNMPMLFNILAVIGVFSLLKWFYRLLKGQFRLLKRIQSVNSLMALSIIFPLILLSIIPHQEPRFIIPLQLPLIYLFSNTIKRGKTDNRWKSTLKSSALAVWCFSNLILFIFNGFFHQGGIIPAANHIHYELKYKPRLTNVHIFTSHIYNIPESLLLTDSTSKIRFNSKTKKKYVTSKQLHMYELGSKTLNSVINHITSIWNVNELKLKTEKKTFRMYLILPNSLRNELIMTWGKSNVSLVLYEEKLFFPHISMEAMPYFPQTNDPSCLSNYTYISNVTWNVKLTILEQIECYLRQFSLIMFKIDKLSFVN